MRNVMYAYFIVCIMYVQIVHMKFLLLINKIG
jgi:hypothetical protein